MTLECGPSLESLAAELARIREELAHTEDRFTSFLESETEAIFCYEPSEGIPVTLSPSEIATRFLEAKLVICNRLYAKARGAERPSDLFGRGMRELARENIDRVRQLIETLIVEGNQHDGVEIKQLQPDGSLRYALARAHLVNQGGFAKRLWVILKDITEQKQLKAERETLELQLRQAQRMESLGLLAGGIAHDFNNLLVVIENCANLAMDDMQSDPAEARESLRQIAAASERAAELTRSLLAFTRRTTGALKPMNVDSLVRDLVSLLRRLVPARVQLETRFNSPTVVARVDRGQVEQVLVNLVINAVDAIADVGTITLATNEVDLTPLQRSAYPWVLATTYHRLSVSDTGVGISPDIRARIFEPFFTTKTDGKGTGLGLAVVWGCAKQHGGFVEVETATESAGTRFCVYLPSCELAATAATPLHDSLPARGGNETVLLIEDHDLVREVSRSVMQRAGYKVLVACDGAEALKVFANHKDDIAVVILDAVMPVVNGYAVFQQISAQRPAMPIIVASGYSGEVFPASFFFEANRILLPKPYMGEQLLLKLRQVLGQPMKIGP